MNEEPNMSPKSRSTVGSQAGPKVARKLKDDAIIRRVSGRVSGMVGLIGWSVASIATAGKERDELKRKNEEFDQQRAALLSQALDEAETERERLLDEARHAADAMSAKRQESLVNDDELLGDINGSFHCLRQSGIDADLFGVISGFEALDGSPQKSSTVGVHPIAFAALQPIIIA